MTDENNMIKFGDFAAMADAAELATAEAANTALATEHVAEDVAELEEGEKKQEDASGGAAGAAPTTTAGAAGASAGASVDGSEEDGSAGDDDDAGPARRPAELPPAASASVSTAEHPRIPTIHSRGGSRDSRGESLLFASNTRRRSQSQSRSSGTSSIRSPSTMFGRCSQCWGR